MKELFVPFHDTELLLGVASPVTGTDRHWLLADWDDKGLNKILEICGNVLFKKRGFGNCYIIKSGHGYHLINFSHKLKLKTYVQILKELKVDPKYIKWVERVSYGVLRLSRKSPHKQVPELVGVLQPPYPMGEDIFTRNLYFNLLNLERQINEIKKVRVYDKEN
jgi:hypothetical protein